jgi:hypothetical protein
MRFLRKKQADFLSWLRWHDPSHAGAISALVSEEPEVRLLGEETVSELPQNQLQVNFSVQLWK